MQSPLHVKLLIIYLILLSQSLKMTSKHVATFSWIAYTRWTKSSYTVYSIITVYLLLTHPVK